MKTRPLFTPPTRRRLHNVHRPLGDIPIPPSDVVRRFFRRVEQVARRHRGNHRSMILAGAVGTLLFAAAIAGVALLVTDDSGDGTGEPQGNAADNSPAAPATSSDTGTSEGSESAGAGADAIGAPPASADPAGGVGGPSADEPSTDAPVVGPPGQSGRPGRDGAPAPTPTPTPIINLPTPPATPTTPPLPTPIIGFPTPPPLPTVQAVATPGVSGLPTVAAPTVTVPTVGAPSLAVPTVAAPTTALP